MRIELSKSRLTNHEFLALCSIGKIRNHQHREFYGPSPNDVLIIRLQEGCRDMKLNEVSARRAARRGTLEAWKVEGVWYTKLINLRKWKDFCDELKIKVTI